MKIFFDTEFTGLHKDTTLISIGLVAENGRTFYAELDDYDRAQVNEWIQKNVIDNLIISSPEWGSLSLTDPEPNEPSVEKSIEVILLQYNRKDIAGYLERWLTSFGEQIEMWSDCLAYDWVLFNDLFGHAFNIPSNVYYIPFDICTLFKLKGIDPNISREDFVFKGKIGDDDLREWKNKKHNALYDARVIKACYEKLMQM